MPPPVKKERPLSLVNGEPREYISVYDRGFNYGDGVFETVLARGKKLCLWEFHEQRLARGCEALNLNFCEWESLRYEADTLLRTAEAEAALKIIISRGGFRRGYRIEREAKANRVLSLRSLDRTWSLNAEQGITLGACEFPLMNVASRLVGVKHLCRIEQVLARCEWEEEYQECLMFDSDGNIVEGTMTNVFLLRGKSLFTPLIDRCGIAGVMRRYLLTNAWRIGLDVSEKRLTLADLLRGDCVFVCNAIIGVCPVKRLGEREWVIPQTFLKIRELVNKR